VTTAEISHGTPPADAESGAAPDEVVQRARRQQRDERDREAEGDARDRDEVAGDRRSGVTGVAGLVAERRLDVLLPDRVFRELVMLRP
jgi:hypothetical protein